MPVPDIEIADVRAAPVRDDELEGMLGHAYVDAGFTDPAVAASLFAASSVRRRGQLLVARDAASRALVGMVIVVLPTSPARRMANADEVELHLLAVAPERRGAGIGKALVDAALASARTLAYRRAVLWTQPSMHAAQRLYSRAGFQRAPQRDWRRGDRSFLVYERAL